LSERCDGRAVARRRQSLGKQWIDPMPGNANEELLRFLLVAGFLLALVAVLIVVGLLVRQS
jgi:hypothetical protein